MSNYAQPSSSEDTKPLNFTVGMTERNMVSYDKDIKFVFDSFLGEQCPVSDCLSDRAGPIDGSDAFGICKALSEALRYIWTLQRSLGSYEGEKGRWEKTVKENMESGYKVMIEEKDKRIAELEKQLGDMNRDDDSNHGSDKTAHGDCKNCSLTKKQIERKQKELQAKEDEITALDEQIEDHKRLIAMHDQLKEDYRQLQDRLRQLEAENAEKKS